MKKILYLALLAVATKCFATGMVPETSVLLVDAQKGEASMNVKNTDSQPALLYTNIVDLPDSDKSIRLIVSQPVVRVDAGETQRMRFLLQTSKPIKYEELKRVTFEGIPPKEKGKDKVALTIGQDLPVVIHPAGLPEETQPWKFLTWNKKDDGLVINNPSDYVVRITASFKTLPSGKSGVLDKTYILPHTSIKTILPNFSDNKVEFYPASRYGYKGDRFTTDLK
ncbi:fimbria/pilus chaperone family protein [Enterobacter roggenkampii]|uniref:fimbria/pilus chaperone family protein n=1 Tax=Enterobacter TaxID=547 RepID=UPI0007507B77|nr:MULTISPECIES: fimbria/pilus chaperone family protein [Enterobacter]AYA13554.1 fimbrial chaperone protein [Enterobacter cloacae]KUQ10848.1 fimbrial chaperone protein [Enterobacter roggenkampii]MBW9386853.1 fimbria/pilus periplasmic chaperone [Enterobacter sp. EC_62]MBW9443516.1 fimbria/pilus periplasmic chaperone [Enterobacter sp. EC_50]MDU7155301.1 fimbria/pilus chaperone family protein [Enterobacter sp.]